MEFSKSEIENILNFTNEYFKKEYPNGVTLQEILLNEDKAFKRYVKFMANSIEKGKIQDNSKCNKLRYRWFVLETIKKVMKMNNLEQIDNFDFCINSLNKQSNKLLEYIKQEKYQAYLTEYSLDK